MAKLVFGMSQSLDGYVDDAAGTLCMPAPGPAVFRHFLDVVAGHAGAIYGRRIYEVMRYWDVDRPEWDVAEREFAAAWQRQPKWVASRTLAPVGPNTTLIRGDLGAIDRFQNAAYDLVVEGESYRPRLKPTIEKACPAPERPVEKKPVHPPRRGGEGASTRAVLCAITDAVAPVSPWSHDLEHGWPHEPGE